MKIVIDTNVIISAILSPRGTPALILERWRQGAFELVVPDSLLSEYTHSLDYPRIRERYSLTSEEVAGLISSLENAASKPRITEQVNIVERDPSDNRVLECAIAGEADYIVTGDAHLLELEQFRGIDILSPAMFLTLLGTQGGEEPQE